MTENHSNRTAVHPVVAALAVAMFGVLAMLIVDHGPWNRPQCPDRRDRQSPDDRRGRASRRRSGGADRAKDGAGPRPTRAEACAARQSSCTLAAGIESGPGVRSWSG